MFKIKYECLKELDTYRSTYCYNPKQCSYWFFLLILPPFLNDYTILFCYWYHHPFVLLIRNIHFSYWYFSYWYYQSFFLLIKPPPFSYWQYNTIFCSYYPFSYRYYTIWNSYRYYPYVFLTDTTIPLVAIPFFEPYHLVYRFTGSILKVTQIITKK